MSEGPETQASSASQEIHFRFRFHLRSAQHPLWLSMTLREKLGIQVLSDPWGFISTPFFPKEL